MSVVALEPSIQSVLPTATEEEVTWTDGSQDMGKDAFFKLLITQLRYQDPLNPVDSVDFTAQLAQFTSLEQLYNINSNFTGLNTALQVQNNFQAINLVGKDVEALGNSLSVIDGESTGGVFNLADTADSVLVYIYNPEGVRIRTLNLGAQNAGGHSFEWDAQNIAGKTVGDGDYRFEVVAKDSQSMPIEVSSHIQGRVTGLTFSETGETVLLLNELKIGLGDIIKVLEPRTSEE